MQLTVFPWTSRCLSSRIRWFGKISLLGSLYLCSSASRCKAVWYCACVCGNGERFLHWWWCTSNCGTWIHFPLTTNRFDSIAIWFAFVMMLSFWRSRCTLMTWRLAIASWNSTFGWHCGTDCLSLSVWSNELLFIVLFWVLILRFTSFVDLDLAEQCLDNIEDNVTSTLVSMPIPLRHTFSRGRKKRPHGLKRRWTEKELALNWTVASDRCWTLLTEAGRNFGFLYDWSIVESPAV